MVAGRRTARTVAAAKGTTCVTRHVEAAGSAAAAYGPRRADLESRGRTSQFEAGTLSRTVSRPSSGRRAGEDSWLVGNRRHRWIGQLQGDGDAGSSGQIAVDGDKRTPHRSEDRRV